MRITQMEEMEVWKASFELTKTVYQLTKRVDFSKDYSLKDQFRRASISIMNNIAEGFGRSGNKEFIQFLGVAKGSCLEVRSMAYVASDQNYISKKDFHGIMTQTDNIQRMLGGFIKYLKGSNLKGGKFD